MPYSSRPAHAGSITTSWAVGVPAPQRAVELQDPRFRASGAHPGGHIVGIDPAPVERRLDVGDPSAPAQALAALEDGDVPSSDVDSGRTSF